MSSTSSLPQASVDVKFLFDASTEELTRQGITEYVDVYADGRELRYVIRDGVRYQCFANEGNPFTPVAEYVQFPVDMERPVASSATLTDEDLEILEEMYRIDREEQDWNRALMGGWW